MPVTVRGLPRKNRSLTNAEHTQVHAYLSSRRAYFLTNNPSYEELASDVERSLGLAASLGALRKLTQTLGIPVRRASTDPARLEEVRKKRQATMRKLIAEGKVKPFVSGDPRIRSGARGPRKSTTATSFVRPSPSAAYPTHNRLRRLDAAQVQEIQNANTDAQRRGFKLDKQAVMSHYGISGSVLYRVLRGTYLLPGNSNPQNPGIGRGNRGPARFTQNGTGSPTTTSDPAPNVVKAHYDVLGNKVDSLIKARDTDRSITLRLLQENAVLAGLLRAVIAGIHGLYEGLGVDQKHIPKSPEYRQEGTPANV